MSDTPQNPFGDIYAELKRAQAEPVDEKKPDPIRCNGVGPGGVQCDVMIRAFAMFGHWNQPSLCEDCRDGNIEMKSKAVLLESAYRDANLPVRSGTPSAINESLRQWLDSSNTFAYAWASRGVTDQLESVVRRYISDRTSAMGRASARMDTEYMMINRLRGSGDATPFDYVRPRLLVIDQVGHMECKPFVNESWHGILSERDRLGRKTLIGSVWRLSELKSRGYEPTLLKLIFDLAGGEKAHRKGTLDVVEV